MKLSYATGTVDSPLYYAMHHDPLTGFYKIVRVDGDTETRIGEVYEEEDAIKIVDLLSGNGCECPDHYGD